MADKEDNKDEQNDAIDAAQNAAQNVASMGIASIITALHQNAIKQANAASKGAEIQNSAIAGKENDAKIKTAGEHIIAVKPIAKDTTIKKKDAIQLLAKYVQWFVGPDLASKVTDSTVKSLTESPANESKKFMSFKTFMLLEADGDSAPKDTKTDGKDDSSETKGKDGDSKKGEAKDKDKDKDKDASSNVDENVESKLGYYIAYNLKIEGFPQNALKDSMKKFAKTFFDDVKITAKGLFGGGDSFTVGDVKKAFRSAFGPIDPDDLVRNVKTRIEKLYDGSDDPKVIVQDKETLISDLDDQIDTTQKKQISSANYSLFIRVNEHDPKKTILNARKVADIVTSSIKGLFKKFKNKVIANDVIYIPDYKDKQEDADKIKKLYNSVPKPDEIFKIINTARNANEAAANIEKKIDVLHRNDQRDNCPRALKCNAAWQKFESDNKESPEEKAKIVGSDAVKKYFSSFMEEYKKAFEATKDPSIDATVNESLFALSSIEDIVKRLVIESLVEADGEDSEQSKYDVDSKQIEDKVNKMLTINEIDKIKDVFVGTYSDIKKKLDYYKASTLESDFKDPNSKDDSVFKNGILACTNANTLSESFDNTDYMKSRIMSILFEEDTNTSSNKDASINFTELAKKLKSVFAKVLDSFGISDYSEDVKMYKLDTIDESLDSLYDSLKKRLIDYIESYNLTKDDALKPDTIKKINKEQDLRQSTKLIREWIIEYFDNKSKGVAYVFPFGKDAEIEIPKSDDTSKDTSDSYDRYSTIGKYDAYIVPIKGLAHEDPEYDTTKIK